MSRLTLSLIAVVLLAFLGLSWLIDGWYQQRFASDDQDPLGSYKMLAAELRTQLNNQYVTATQLQQWAASSPLAAQISRYQDFPIPQDLAAKFEQGEPLLLDSTEHISLNYYLANSQTVLSVNFAAPDSSQHNILIKWTLTLGFYAGVILLLLIWLMPLLHRLHLLRAAAEAVGRGELQRRIPLTGVSYIRDIETEFNAMAARLENLIRDNKILSRGLSHDLRTPLARLRFGLDVLAEENPSPQQHAKLEHLNRDLLDMELLVETLLDYSKLEEANIRLQLVPIDLVSLVQEVIGLSYREDVDLHINCESAVIMGHGEYLAMLLNNIIQNALRYGNGKIRLSVQYTINQVALTCEDNGPGIPLAERRHVLIPFYRCTNPGGIKGHGMGLALVERIAHWHNAQLLMTDSKVLGGLLISVIFILDKNAGEQG